MTPSNAWASLAASTWKRRELQDPLSRLFSFLWHLFVYLLGLGCFYSANWVHPSPILGTSDITENTLSKWITSTETFGKKCLPLSRANVSLGDRELKVGFSPLKLEQLESALHIILKMNAENQQFPCVHARVVFFFFLRSWGFFFYLKWKTTLSAMQSTKNQP